MQKYEKNQEELLAGFETDKIRLDCKVEGQMGKTRAF